MVTEARTEPSAGDCLGPSEFIDSDHPDVAAFVAEHGGSSSSPREQVVALYLAIRDGYRYSPWGVATTREEFRASAVASRQDRFGHCIDKANLLAACARHIGVPARLHFANVRNHIGTEALEKQLGTDLLVFHGYCEIYLNDRWVAATPAFNRALCEKLGVPPLEFDGLEDSIFQQYGRDGELFMEYVHDYGSFADIPYELMVAEWHKHYPAVRNGTWPRRPAS